MFLVNFTYYILQPNMFNTDWQPLLQASYSHKNHCVKCFHIQNYSGPHFSRIFPHSDCISVSLCIQSECGKMREKCSISPYSVQMRENEGKMRTRITPNTDSKSTYLIYLLQCALCKLILGNAKQRLEAVVKSCSVKKVFLDISQNSQENTCVRLSFLIKLQANFIKKETLAQVFSCELCEISENIFFM